MVDRTSVALHPFLVAVLLWSWGTLLVSTDPVFQVVCLWSAVPLAWLSAPGVVSLWLVDDGVLLPEFQVLSG